MSFLARQGQKIVKQLDTVLVKLVKFKYLNNNSSTFFKAIKPLLLQTLGKLFLTKEACFKKVSSGFLVMVKSLIFEMTFG